MKIPSGYLFSLSEVWILVFAAVLVTACTPPRIIVLSDPLNPAEHNDLGVAYERRGEWELAVREYRRAAEADEEWALPLINLGNVYASRQAWEKAAKAYRKALRRERRNADAMNNLAWILLQEGKTEKALRWVWRATGQCSECPQYLDTLAEIHLVRGETAVAHRIEERAAALSAAGENSELKNLEGR